MAQYGTVQYWQDEIQKEKKRKELVDRLVSNALSASIITSDELELVVEIRKQWGNTQFYEQELAKVELKAREEADNETN